MEGICEADAQLATPAAGHARVAVEIDESIYGLDVIFKAAYRFTDRCYLLLSRNPDAPRHISVTLMAKKPSLDLRLLLGDFYNELIDQQIREALSREAGPLRELIVAQAFAEGNLLDEQREEGDYESDPLGIGRSR